MANPSLNFRLSPELLAAAASYAKSIDRTPGWVARTALDKYLSELNRVGRKPKKAKAA